MNSPTSTSTVTDMPSRPVSIQASKLSVGYGIHTVVRDIDMEVRAGEFVAVTGPSGSGKSSLLNVIGLLDHQVGRILGALKDQGLADNTLVIFTTDHGEFQGDFGLLFKGPYHVDALMRIPLIWRPAPSTAAVSAVVTRPVGLVDLAPTFCAIAGLPAPEWMEGKALPANDTDADQRGFERVLTEWDSDLFGVAVHLRTITRDGWVCTAYQPGYSHDGTEGELYDLSADPLQQVHRRHVERQPQRAGGADRPVERHVEIAGAVAAETLRCVDQQAGYHLMIRPRLSAHTLPSFAQTSSSV